MPLENRLLRDVSVPQIVSSVLPALFEELLGDVECPPWLEVSLYVARNEASFLSDVFITVRVAPHQLLLPTLGSLQDPEKNLPLLSRGPASIEVLIPIRDQELRQFREDLPRLFTDKIRENLLAHAHDFYEFDPRCGWQANAVSSSALPRCPLFDPKSPFSRTGWEREPLRCPFCDRQLIEYPIWAGGNLRWVHSKCWRRVCS